MPLINDRYDLVRPIGHGGTGSVFLARDILHEDTLVAVKIVPVNRLAQGRLREVRNEFYTLSGLDHPNLVQALDFGTIRTAEAPHRAGDHYLTYEYIEGDNLLRATAGVSWQELAELAYQVLRTLGYIHRHGLIHFDVKPENVLVVAGSISSEEVRLAKLIDFGFSSTSIGESRSVRGTLAYLAPEFLSSGRADHRADLYSFGVTMYQLATGMVPVDDGTTFETLKRRLTDPPRDLRVIHPDVPAELDTVVRALTMADPDRRVQTADDAAAMIEPFLARTSLFTQYYRTLRPSLFIGRSDELRLLTHNLKQLQSIGRSTEPQRLATPVIVTGPHGIGKTRLLRELAREAHVSDVVFLEARCAGSAERAFVPFLPLLRELHLRHASVIDRSWEEEISSLVRLLSEGTEHIRDNDPASLRFRIIERVARFLAECAAHHPFVVWVDDADLADEATLDLIGHLGRSAPALGFLMFIGATSLEAEPLKSLLVGTPGQLLLLKDLTPEEACQFVRHHTGDQALPAEEIARLTAQVGASPLVLSHYLSAAMRNPGPVSGTGLLERASITSSASIMELYRQRFDALGRDERDCLRLLSCFPVPVETPLFVRLLAFSPTRTRQSLARLSNEGLISSPEFGRIFVPHGQFREFVYSGLGGMRVTLHRHIAEALERATQSRGDDLAEELAYHFHRSGDLRKAYYAYVRAAEKEQAVSSFRRSAEFLEHARTLAPSEAVLEIVLERLAETYRALSEYGKAEQFFRQLLDTASTRERRLKFHRTLGILQTSLGRIEDAGQSFQDAAILCVAQAERDEVDLDRTSLEISRGDYTEARRLLDDLRQRAHEIPDPQHRGDILNRLGIVSFHENRLEAARKYFTESVEAFGDQGPPEKRISPLLNLGNIYSFQGDFAHAEERWKQALTLTKKACNIGLEARIYNNLGIADFSLENYPEAATHYERAIDIFTRLGNRPGQALCLTNIGEVHYALGAYEQALEVWRSNLTIYESLTDNEGIAQVSIHLAHALLMLGDLTGAALRLAAASALVENAGVASQKGVRDLAQATLEFHRDDLVRAGATLDTAAAFFEGALDWRNLCLAQLLRGKVAIANGTREEAADAFQRALQVARERSYRILRAEALCGLAVTSGPTRSLGLSHPISYLKEAFDLIEHAPVVETTWHVCLALGDAYRRRGLFSKAETYIRIAADSVNYLASRFQTELLRSRFLTSHGRSEPGERLATLQSTSS